MLPAHRGIGSPASIRLPPPRAGCGLCVDDPAGGFVSIDATHGMIAAKPRREDRDQHEHTHDEWSTQLPSRTGKIRQEWQPAAEDEGNRSGARKQEGGKPG